MLAKLDRLIENDTAAGLGSIFLALLIGASIALGIVPESSEEIAETVIAMLFGFGPLALRRGSNSASAPADEPHENDDVDPSEVDPDA